MRWRVGGGDDVEGRRGGDEGRRKGGDPGELFLVLGNSHPSLSETHGSDGPRARRHPELLANDVTTLNCELSAQIFLAGGVPPASLRFLVLVRNTSSFV